MIKLVMIILILLLFQGCANVTSVYYPDKQGYMVEVIRIKQNTQGAVTYKPETQEVTVDSRKTNWWQQNVVPMFSGVLDKASRAR